MTPRGPIDEICVNVIRTLTIDAVQAAHSGHPGTPLVMAPVVHTLWQDFLRCDPADAIRPSRDRFVLSSGHASALPSVLSPPSGGGAGGRTAAGCRIPHRRTGPAGAILGLHTFEASALRAKFGVTGEHLYAAARAQLARKE